MRTTSERELSTTANSPSIEISPPQRPTLPDAARRVPLFLGDVTIMVDSDNSARFPGWYNDPGDSAMERFWDGRQWTESVRDAATAQAANADVLVDLTSVQATVGTLPAKDNQAPATRPTDAAPLKDAFAKDVPAADAVRKVPPAVESPIIESPIVEDGPETPAVAPGAQSTQDSDTSMPTANEATAPTPSPTPEAIPEQTAAVATPEIPEPATAETVTSEPSMGLFAQPRSSENGSASLTASPTAPDAANGPSLFDKRAEATERSEAAQKAGADQKSEAEKSEPLPVRSDPRERSVAKAPQPSATAAKPGVTSMAEIIRTTTLAAAQSEAGTASPKAAKASAGAAKAEQATNPAPKPAAVPKTTPRPKADIPKPKPVETPKAKSVEPKPATPTNSTSTIDGSSQKRWGVLAVLAGACLAAGGFLFGYLAGGSGDTAAPPVTTEAPTTTIAQTEPAEPAVDQGSLDALAAAEARVEELESASASSSDQVASLEGEIAELTEARDNESAHNELLQSWFTADVLARSQASWDAEVARGCGLVDEPTLDNLNYGRRLEVVGTPADLLAAVLDCRS